MKKILTALTLLIIVFAGCNNDDDNTPQNPSSQLPPPTQTGENTFGFLLNGQPVNVTNTSQQVAIYQGGVLQLGGGVDNSSMDIHVIINTSETIILNEPIDLTNTPDNIAIFVNNGSGCYYDFPNTNNGFLTITNFNHNNFIVSGKFEFSTVTENCEPVEITNGRFDMQYIP